MIYMTKKSKTMPNSKSLLRTIIAKNMMDTELRARIPIIAGYANEYARLVPTLNRSDLAMFLGILTQSYGGEVKPMQITIHDSPEAIVQLRVMIEMAMEKVLPLIETTSSRTLPSLTTMNWRDLFGISSVRVNISPPSDDDSGGYGLCI